MEAHVFDRDAPDRKLQRQSRSRLHRKSGLTVSSDCGITSRSGKDRRGVETRMQTSVRQMADGITPYATPGRPLLRPEVEAVLMPVRTDDDAVRRAAVRVGEVAVPA